jgi:hypothetical protein
VAHPQIAAFARMAKENAKPNRLLAGQATRLSRTMHDIRYDEIHDEFFVTNPFAQAVLVFRGGADGEEAPIRIIQGPHTQLDNPDRLEEDPVHDEILIPGGDRILVFPRTATGDVAPIRVIRGPETQLSKVGSMAVDPVHNLLVAGTGTAAVGGIFGPEDIGTLLIYNRTDNGNVKPRAVIGGPKTEIISIHQIRIYSPKGWIVVAQPGDSYLNAEPKGIFVGVWSIHDNGDVPPRWKIGGPKSLLKKPRGVALNPKNKELIVADMRLNAVLTYYFPEIF